MRDVVMILAVGMAANGGLGVPVKDWVELKADASFERRMFIQPSSVERAEAPPGKRWVSVRTKVLNERPLNTDKGPVQHSEHVMVVDCDAGTFAMAAHDYYDKDGRIVKAIDVAPKAREFQEIQDGSPVAEIRTRACRKRG